MWHIRKFIPQTLQKRLPKEIKIVEISESKSRKFNREYRKKNKPANVLSFLYGSDYGEILVCPEIVQKEAKKQRNSYKYQMTWMVLHGILHLAGLHHEKSRNTAKIIEKLEQRILGKIFVTQVRGKATRV